MPVFQGLVGSGGRVRSGWTSKPSTAFHSPSACTGPLGAKRRCSRLGLGRGLGSRAGAADGGPLELEAVGVVEQAVADGIGQVGIADDGVPVLGQELTGDEGGGPLRAILDDLDQIPALAVAQGCQEPVVD